MSDDTRHADEFDFRGAWLTSRQAQRYVCCKSLNSWYVYRLRHGIIPRANGSVAKRDLDRVLKAKKPRRVMHPKSLANLQRRCRPITASSSERVWSVIDSEQHADERNTFENRARGWQSPPPPSPTCVTSESEPDSCR